MTAAPSAYPSVSYASRPVIRRRGMGLINVWRRDWNKFVRDALGVRLDPEQQEILHSVQVNPRTSVASGTARGKDFVAACAALSFLYLTPRWRMNAAGRPELAENTKVALTAPTDRQVKNIMMPEISRLFNKAKARGVVLPGRLNAYDIRTDSSEWFLTGFKADENNHEAWSGFHAVHTMFVVTEATGIGDDTFSAIEGNLQGDSRILLVFNPNTSVGYAARSQKGDRWAHYSLNNLTAPNVVQRRLVIPGQVDYEWVRDKIENWCTPIREDEVSPEMDDFLFEGRWYRPEDLCRKKVLGKFPKIADDALIPQQWLDLAHERWRAAGGQDSPKERGPRILGVDVAGMGRDNSCLVERHGDWVDRVFTHNSGGGADHMKIAGMILDRRRRKKDMIVSIDTIGEGAGVYSRLIEADDPAHHISCKYSEAAKRRDKALTDVTGQYAFLNMRAYLHWAVRDWLNPKNGSGAMLPPDPRLDEEATEIRWSFRSDGRIFIEPKEDIKERLGRSPDRFDALANTFYPIARNPVDVGRIADMIGR
ncbi:MAG: hypothetical protein LUC24_00805 [Bacteroidales bacterium]|nr:hypothetical protein [Bacteroidales bacterium]